MSKYTTEVRFICERAAELDESKGYNDIDSIITAAAPKVFSFDFPIYDESYRLVLEKKILRHYYTREICEETVGLWKLRLEDRLNMIMPYFNEMYRSQVLEYNPLYDVDITRTHEGERSGTNTNRDTIARNGSNSSTITDNGSGSRQTSSSSQGSTTGTHWDLYSDTPQGGINGVEGDTIDNMVYLSNARKNTDSEGSTGSGTEQETTTSTNTTTATGTNESSETRNGNETVNNTEEYTERVFGKQGSGSYSKLIADFRKAIINVDQMIIDELKDLFFGLW